MAVGTKAAEESSLSAAAFVSAARTAIGQFYPNEIHFSSFYKNHRCPDGFSGFAFFQPPSDRRPFYL